MALPKFDIVVDFETRKVWKILPYMIHSEGYTYAQLGKKINDGRAILITENEDDKDDVELFGLHNGQIEWHPIEKYSE